MARVHYLLVECPMTEDEINEMQRLKNLNRSKQATAKKRKRETLIWELELQRRLKEQKEITDGIKNNEQR